MAPDKWKKLSWPWQDSCYNAKRPSKSNQVLTLDPVVSLELAAETIWKAHPVTLPDLLYGPQSTWLHEIEPKDFEKHYM